MTSNLKNFPAALCEGHLGVQEYISTFHGNVKLDQGICSPPPSMESYWNFPWGRSQNPMGGGLKPRNFPWGYANGYFLEQHHLTYLWKLYSRLYQFQAKSLPGRHSFEKHCQLISCPVYCYVNDYFFISFRFRLLFIVFSFSFLGGGVAPDAMCRSYKLRAESSKKEILVTWEKMDCGVGGECNSKS